MLKGLFQEVLVMRVAWMESIDRKSFSVFHILDYCGAVELSLGVGVGVSAFRRVP